MDRPVPAPAVLPRACVLGAVGVLLAVLAHGSTDGARPGLLALGAAWLVLSAVSVPALHREWRLPALLIVLAVEQTALHMAFVRGATGRWTHGGSVGWLCCGDGTPVPAGPGVHVAGVGLDRAALVQLLCRAVAVAVCAWWLARGERRLWTAARVVARGVGAMIAALPALARALLVPIVRGPERPRPEAPDRCPRPGLVLARAVARRGPPLPV